MSITDQAFIRAYRQDASPGDRKVARGKVLPHAETPAAQPSAGLPAQEFASDQQPPTTDFRAPDGQQWVLHDAHDRLVPHLATFGGEGFSSGTATMSLSAFKGQHIEPTVHCEARPALEVDSVRWPAMCDTLLEQFADRFDALAERIAGEAAAGCKVVAISGVRRGEGRTTFCLCLARSLAKKCNVALVDADFAKPALAEQLGLEVGLGWEAACCHRDSIWESAIESMGDSLTLAPLGRAIGEGELAPVHFQISRAIDALGQQYDVVLLDAGAMDLEPSRSKPAATPWLSDPAIGIDGIILAHDVRNSDGSRLAAACLQLAGTGRRQLGIAEMFVTQ